MHSTTRLCVLRQLALRRAHSSLPGTVMSPSVSDAQVEKIGRFSSCEIADALVQLKCPSGGYLPDITLQTAPLGSSRPGKLCGEVFTVEMVAATDTESPRLAQHYVDAGEKDTVMVISTPPNSKSAVWGGLMTARAKHKGIKGVVIDGRCRDLAEHREANYMVFARGHSILGQSTFTRPARIQVPLTIHPVFEPSGASTGPASFPPTIVNPHDVLVGDEDGVVVVPNKIINQVIDLCTLNLQVDHNCFTALKQGHSIAETFAKYRGK